MVWTESALPLDDLMAAIEERVVDTDYAIRAHDYWDGSQSAILTVDGALVASWRAELAAPPVWDGVTPRGARRYHSLTFHDGPVTS